MLDPLGKDIVRSGAESQGFAGRIFANIPINPVQRVFA
jgi:hypothetical protein